MNKTYAMAVRAGAAALYGTNASAFLGLSWKSLKRDASRIQEMDLLTFLREVADGVEAVVRAELGRLEGLEDRVATTRYDVEAEDLVCGRLERRQELAGVFEVVTTLVESFAQEEWEGKEQPEHRPFWTKDDALHAAVQQIRDEGPEVKAAYEMADAICVAIGRLDEALQGHLDVLTIATGTNLLRNWRAALAPRPGGFAPWWIDDVERRAEQMYREAVAGLAPAPRR